MVAPAQSPSAGPAVNTGQPAPGFGSTLASGLRQAPDPGANLLAFSGAYGNQFAGLTTQSAAVLGAPGLVTASYSAVADTRQVSEGLEISQQAAALWAANPSVARQYPDLVEAPENRLARQVTSLVYSYLNLPANVTVFVLGIVVGGLLLNVLAMGIAGLGLLVGALRQLWTRDQRAGVRIEVTRAILNTALFQSTGARADLLRSSAEYDAGYGSSPEGMELASALGSTRLFQSAKAEIEQGGQRTTVGADQEYGHVYLYVASLVRDEFPKGSLAMRIRAASLTAAPGDREVLEAFLRIVEDVR